MATCDWPLGSFKCFGYDFFFVILLFRLVALILMLIILTDFLSVSLSSIVKAKVYLLLDWPRFVCTFGKSDEKLLG